MSASQIWSPPLIASPKIWSPLPLGERVRVRGPHDAGPHDCLALPPPHPRPLSPAGATGEPSQLAHARSARGPSPSPLRGEGWGEGQSRHAVRPLTRSVSACHRPSPPAPLPAGARGARFLRAPGDPSRPSGRLSPWERVGVRVFVPALLLLSILTSPAH